MSDGVAYAQSGWSIGLKTPHNGLARTRMCSGRGQVVPAARRPDLLGPLAVSPDHPPFVGRPFRQSNQPSMVSAEIPCWIRVSAIPIDIDTRSGSDTKTRPTP